MTTHPPRQRLAVAADDAALWQAVALRLRRSTLTHVPAQELAARASEFDALVLGGGAIPIDEINTLANAHRPILLLDPYQYQRAEIETLLAVGPSVRFAQLLRYRPEVAAVQAALASGQLGAPALVRLHHWGAPAAGVLPACLEVIRWLFQELPMQVFASRHRAVEHCVQVHLGFATGGMALVDVAPLTGAGYFSLSVIGRTGAAHADDHHNTHLGFRGGPPAALLADIPACGSLALLLDDFAATMGNTQDDSFRLIQQLMDAMAESLAAGQPVQYAGGRYAVVA